MENEEYSLYDHLIYYGYSFDIAKDIAEAYDEGGMEMAESAMAWADDYMHDYSGALKRDLKDWTEKNNEMS